MNVALALTVGISFLVSGFVARRRRPGNATGALMLFAGAAWLVAALSESEAPLPWTVGTALVTLGKAVLLHLVLAFPHGRLHGRAERVLVAILYLDVTVASLALMSVTADPRNLLLVEADAGAADAVHLLQRVVAIWVLAGVLVLLTVRWRRATPPLRRALGPVLATGAVAIVLAALTILASGLSGTAYDALTIAQIAAFAAIPPAFLAGLLRSWLSRSGVAELLVDLQEPTESATLEARIARTLGDPGVRVAYRFGDRHIDAAGRPVELPATGVTPVRHAGEEVGALLHDPDLDDRELLAAVAAAAGLALRNERLQAELRARLEELHASRARIVRAGDEERRRLERNLHDGAQQRLVSLALALGLAEEILQEDPADAAELVAQARHELAEAIQELRDLAHGIHPAVLAERGLPMALEALAERAPLPVTVRVDAARLPEPVEAALYYVAAEALTNAAKHAEATRLSVELGRDGGSVFLTVRDDGRGGASADGGTGLLGLADRLDALNGRLTVTSPPAGGTSVEVEIPCA